MSCPYVAGLGLFPIAVRPFSPSCPLRSTPVMWLVAFELNCPMSFELTCCPLFSTCRTHGSSPKTALYATEADYKAGGLNVTVVSQMKRGEGRGVQLR